MLRRACSAECRHERRGTSGRGSKGRRWHNVGGKRAYIKPYECEHCHKQFPRHLKNGGTRFCSRECSFAERRKNHKGKSCSIWCAHCQICGKAFVSRAKRAVCGRACELEKGRAAYWAKPLPLCVCCKCGTSFYPAPGFQSRKYCSKHYRRYRGTTHCTNCGGAIPVLLSRAGRRTCSPECLQARTEPAKYHHCVECGQRFRHHRKGRHSPNAFCSSGCSIAHMRKIGFLEFRLKGMMRRFSSLDGGNPVWGQSEAGR